MHGIKYQSILRPGCFDGNVILVTGGGSGIGRCIAHELASLGATVVIAGRKKTRLEDVASEIRSLGGKVDVVEMDIRHAENVQDAVRTILQRHGRLDGLVNNAGGQFASPASNISNNGWRAVVDLNLNGTWNVISEVYHAWMREHGGKVVCITADFHNGMPFMAHSGAARAGVDNLVKSLAVEWTPHSGIRINSVSPGTIIGNGMNNYPKDMISHIAKDYAWKNPSGRLGTESEVSSVVCFLLSDAASYINGTCVRVDGGSSLMKSGYGFSTGDVFENQTKIPAFHGFPPSLETNAPLEMLALLKTYKRVSKL